MEQKDDSNAVNTFFYNKYKPNDNDIVVKENKPEHRLRNTIVMV